MKTLKTIFIATFCTASSMASPSIVPSLDLDLEGQTDRGEERIISTYSSTLSVESLSLRWGNFLFGPQLNFSHEFEKQEEAITRFSSLGAKVAFEKEIVSNIDFSLSYNFQLIQDNDLNSKYKLDGFHETAMEFSTELFSAWSVTLGAQAVHFYGGLPQFRSTPNNSIKVFLDNTYDFNVVSAGLEISREQESVIRETGRVNVVFDKLLLIPHITKSFKYLDLQAFAVLDPFRGNYESGFATDTLKDANYGLKITTSQEWK